MSDLLAMSATVARTALDKGEISSRELTQAYLTAAEDKADLNAYITLTPDHALAMAAASDAKLAKNKSEVGILEGIPIGIKDMFCTKGVATTAASRILSGFVPSYESSVTERLWQAGAVMLGKLNCDEFAMGSTNETSAYGAVISPWQKASQKEGQKESQKEVQKQKADSKAKPEALTPGGSSGGSSAAVAARIALLATGTDTGGSIRQPAAFCGLVGLKPTYGRCSRRGIVAFASSLDQAGPIARTVADAALMLMAMAGHDPADSTSSTQAMPDLLAASKASIKGMRVGIPKEYAAQSDDPAINALWEKGREWLEAAGAVAVPISLPHTHYALPTYYIIAPAEASSNLARYDGVRFGMRGGMQGEKADSGGLDAMYVKTRGEGFGDEVKRRILIGTYVLSSGYYDAYYIKAQRVRRLIAGDFAEAFKKTDVLLTPTTPTAAFPLGQQQDPVTVYRNDVFAVPASLAGLPAISVPAGVNGEGLPLGLQLIAPPMEEARLVAAASALEAGAGFSHLPPDTSLPLHKPAQ